MNSSERGMFTVSAQLGDRYSEKAYKTMTPPRLHPKVDKLSPS
jgi:hypothetical protein